MRGTPGLWSDSHHISVHCLLVTIICDLPQRTDYGEKWIAFRLPFPSVCMRVRVYLCAHAYGGQRSAFMLCLGSHLCCFLRQHLSKTPGTHWLGQASLLTSPLGSSIPGSPVLCCKCPTPHWPFDRVLGTHLRSSYLHKEQFMDWAISSAPLLKNREAEYTVWSLFPGPSMYSLPVPTSAIDKYLIITSASLLEL